MKVGSLTVRLRKKRSGILFGLLMAMAFSPGIQAQNKIDLSSLSFAQTPSSNWQIAGDVRADLNKNNVLIVSAGTGVLVSQAAEGQHGSDLLFNHPHGDADLELDFMMAKGSNSGIYMQGQYEIQLLDSWGVVNPTSADVGGIYERWNDAKPDGQKGFDGHAPRQNAGRGPGLWQHIKISFQAPRFDATGNKTANAKILKIVLNGITIQEEVELSGPTRGALKNMDVSTGPLRLQGDHGTVAFRNILLTPFNIQKPALSNIKYAVYRGRFIEIPDYAKLTPEAQGSAETFSPSVSNIPNEFLIRYTGTILISKPGEYKFSVRPSGGQASLKINNKVVTAFNGQQTGEIVLAPGIFPVELFYSKFADWAKPNLNVTVAGQGLRESLISDVNFAEGDRADPILVQATENTILRSFVDIDTFRVTHAVNVGSARNMHYTYDLDNGMIVQVWRGGFIDATPMWDSRGDGSSKPVGSVIKFGLPMPAIRMLSSTNQAWPADTTGSGYRPKGYVLDDSARPTFKYLLHDNMVTDAIRILPGNQGFYRTINLQGSNTNMYLLLAVANSIENPAEGLYLLNDKTYYIRMDDNGSLKPTVRDNNGKKELIIPIQSKISYSILY